jgi:hypothetical protein
VEGRFAQDALKGGQRQVQIAILLHVKIDEFLGRQRGAVKTSEPIRNGGQRSFPVQQIYLTVDGGKFDGNGGNTRIVEQAENGVEAPGRFALAQHGLAQLIDNDARLAGAARGQIALERRGFGRQDDSRRVTAQVVQRQFA